MSLLDRPIALAIARIRVQRAVDGAVTGAAGSVLLMAAPLVLAKLGWLTPDELGSVVAWLLAFPLLGAVIGGLRRVDRLTTAVRLDRANGLGDRFVTAWEIEQLPTGQRTPFMLAHLESVAQAPPRVAVGPAYPLYVPPDAALLAGAAAVVALIGLLAPPQTPFVPWTPPPPVELPRVVTAETEFERERLEELRAQIEPLDDEVLDRALAELEAILDDLELQRDERELYERLDALEELLRERAEALGDESLAELLEQIAEKLSEASATTPLADAIRSEDPEALDAAAAELAARSQSGEMSARERRAAADALAEAAEMADPVEEELRRRQAEARAAAEEARRREAAGDATAEEAAAAEEALEAVEREVSEALSEGGEEAQQREALRESLEESAEVLRQDPAGDQRALRQDPEGTEGVDENEAGEALAETARQLRQLQREQAARDAAGDAQQRADSMREAMQRQGAGGDQQQRADSMREFLERAQGQQQGGQQQGGQQQGGQQQGGQQQGGQQQGGQQQGGQQQGGQQQGGQQQGGQQQGGQQQGGQQQGGQQVAQGGALNQASQGQQGQSQQGGQQQGASGRSLEQLSREQAGQQGDGGQGQGQGQQGQGQGQGEPAGQGAGTGHIERTELDPTSIDSNRDESHVAGRDRGQGESTSEIIASAAGGGFATTAYRDVFQDYARVAEEVVEQETIPGGYRFYITRYFELISPRDPDAQAGTP